MFEKNIPVDMAVQSVCDIVGLDALHLANEGKFIIIGKEDIKEDILKYFPDSEMIGKVTDSGKSNLVMETVHGGLRKLSMMEYSQLPRIC